MIIEAQRPGAADFEMLRAVFAGTPGSWPLFVRQYAGHVYRACCVAFPVAEAKDELVRVTAQLRANDFALLRAFDGRASLSSYLQIVLRDVLSQRVGRLLTDEPERGWRAFEHFFKRDIERIIARHFPAADGDRVQDLYNDIAMALIENSYRRIQGYDGQGSFGGYVRRIVKNLCIDLLRKDVPRRRLPAAIQRLPEFEQEVFRQLYWEKRDAPQILATMRAKGLPVDNPEVVTEAITKVRAALPANFKADGEDARPREVPLQTSADPDSEGTLDLPDDRPTPEGETIAREDEVAMEQASDALRTAITQLPQDIRLYLQHVMGDDPAPAPRVIAGLMGRPVTDIYAMRQQAERMLRQALREHTAIKNLRLSV